MQLRIGVFGLILLASGLAGTALASKQVAPDKLRPDEWNTVALIYNAELSALGERALYPVCISLPPGTPLKSLLKYLRRGGYTVSDPRVCSPNLDKGDYPHGLVIDIDNLRRGPDGQLDVHMTTGDNTIHYGVHFATLLRRGTYSFKQNEKGEWQITSYTKEYDFKDEKKGHGECNVP